jgi:hypothetical protein
MASPNLAAPLYAALIGNADVAAALPAYNGAVTVFTARPVPTDAPYPMIITAGDVTRTDEDLISSQLPVIVRDIAIFGQNDAPAHSRAVEALALTVRDIFHRQRGSLSVPGWSVLDIVCTGPITGPTDDDTTVSRIVTLKVRLSQ